MDREGAVTEKRKLKLRDTLKEAWVIVHGVKKVFFFSLLIYFLIYVASSVLLELAKQPWWLTILVSAIYSLLSAGFIYMGLKRAFDLQVRVLMLFKAFNPRLGAKIIVTQFIVTLIIVLLILLLIVVFSLLSPSVFSEMTNKLITSLSIAIAFMAGFFFIVRLSLAGTIIMAQKQVGPLQAIALSYRATKGNFWRLTAFIIFSLVITALSLLTLGIGFIWSIPFLLIAWGLIYKQLVGDIFNVV